MRKLQMAIVPFLLCGSVAVNAQTITVTVKDAGDSPVYSNVFFRRSASGTWDRLGVTGPDGRLTTELACAPGTEIYADPVPGRYWNSPETTCQQTLPLRVEPRNRVVLTALLPVSEANPDGVATREDLAQAVGQAEALDFTRLGGQYRRTLLHAYLESPSSVTPRRAQIIRENLLNESAGLYSAVDLDRNGELTRAEIQKAISASPE
jgi:hypothetical protein